MGGIFLVAEIKNRRSIAPVNKYKFINFLFLPCKHFLRSFHYIIGIQPVFHQ